MPSLSCESRSERKAYIHPWIVYLTMSRADLGADQPRAMIHRRILDVAESNPDASLAAIAEEVTGASPDLVERVLDEYGDPCRDSEPEDDDPMNAANPTPAETDAVDEQDGSATDEAAGTPAPADLSEKQRRTLRALYGQPDASQGDLAEQLDVTRATVSRRLNAISGFEWDDRRAFAESVFGSEPDADADSEDHVDAAAADSPDDSPDEDSSGDDSARGERTDSDSTGPEDGKAGHPGADERTGVDPAALDAVEGALTDLAERVDAVESRMGESRESGRTDGCDASLSPELAHKVVHACMESDRLTEDEELEVLRAFMDR